RFYERLQRRAFRRFEAVVAVSRPLATLLRNDGIAPSRVHLIPNGYAAPVFSPRDEARQSLGLGPGFVAGWIGRLSHENAPDVFAAALSRRGSDVAGVVVGDGRESTRNPRVIWKGRGPDAGLLIKAFDVLVLSSRTEGTPIVLFEAMAAGVPVVATAVGGVPD